MTKWILALLLVSGCSSARKLSSGADFLKDEVYQKRPTLDESFLQTEEHNLSTEQIKKLLSSKVKEKKFIKLAFFDIGHYNQTFGASYFSSYDSGEKKMSATSQNQAIFSSFQNQTGKVKSVSFIPSFLMPEKITLANLRDAAALIQADYLVIIQAKSELNNKAHVFDPDEALATVNMEVAMMDVATGALPYTSLVTGRSKVEHNEKEDFNYREFKDRALQNAQSAAFLAMTKDLNTVFESNAL